MTTFKTWLEEHSGMANKLSEHLSVSRSVVSNVKHGRIKLPILWIPHIIELSGHTLTLESLFEEIIAWKMRSNETTKRHPPPRNSHPVFHLSVPQDRIQAG